MHRCMLRHDWLQARLQPLIHPATPYSSCHGGSLPPRVFSAASSVVTMATAAWPRVCCCSYDRLDLNSSLHLRWASMHTWLQQLTRFSLLAVKTLWLSVKTSILRRHGWPEAVALPLFSPAHLFQAFVSAVMKISAEKRVEKVPIILAFTNSSAIRYSLILTPLAWKYF